MHARMRKQRSEVSGSRPTKPPAAVTLTHFIAFMLKGALNVASSFFIVVMSNERSRQLSVAICVGAGWGSGRGHIIRQVCVSVIT